MTKDAATRRRYPPLTPRFQLGERLGEGGFGVVYAATDADHPGSEAAVKLAKHPPDAETLARIEREASSVAALKHPGLATLRGLFEHEGTLALVYDRIRGHALGEIAPVSASDASILLSSLAAAVDALHDAGLVHRDIKPENILRCPGGSAVLLDFGLLRTSSSGGTVTKEGWILGTPAFMAPELFRGETATPSSDRFAVAATAYYLLLGRPPFGEDAAALLRRFGSIEPGAEIDVSDLPANLQPLFRTGLALDPSQRPATAGQFVQEFKADQKVPTGKERSTRKLAGASSLPRSPALRSTPLAVARPRSLWLSLPFFFMIVVVSWTFSPTPEPPQVSRPPATNTPAPPAPWLDPIREELRQAETLFLSAEGQFVSLGDSATSSRDQPLLDRDSANWPRLARHLPRLNEFLANHLPTVEPEDLRRDYDVLDAALQDRGLPPAVAPLFDPSSGPTPTEMPAAILAIASWEEVREFYAGLASRPPAVQRVCADLEAAFQLLNLRDRDRLADPPVLPRSLLLSPMRGGRKEGRLSRFLTDHYRLRDNRALLVRWLRSARMQARRYFLGLRRQLEHPAPYNRLLVWVGFLASEPLEHLIAHDVAFLGAAGYAGFQPENELSAFSGLILGRLQEIRGKFLRDQSFEVTNPPAPTAHFRAFAPETATWENTWLIDHAASALLKFANSQKDEALFERVLQEVRRIQDPRLRETARTLWIRLGEGVAARGYLAPLTPAEGLRVLAVARLKATKERESNELKRIEEALTSVLADNNIPVPSR